MSSNKCAWCLECPSTRSQFAANGPAGDSVAKRGYSCAQRWTITGHGISRCFPALMAAIAAVSLRRPVRFVLTREVDTATTGHRCFLEMDSSVITLFDPGMRQVLPSNSVSTARAESSLLDLIWPSMPAAPATSQSPGLTH